jgi:hypothetical protein
MQTLSLPNHGYEDIISALRDSKANDAGNFFKAINKSDWGHPKYNFDVNSKWTQAMMRYNPDKPFGPDTKNPEWYSELPEGGLITIENNEEEDCIGPNCKKKNCTGPNCGGWWDPPPRDGTPPPWWPNGEKFYKPKQKTVDYIEYAYPLVPMREFTGTLQDATNQIPLKKTRSGLSISAATGVYNMFQWGGKKWAKALSSNGEIFELEDSPVINVAGNKAADATVKNVLDRPYGEQFYYYPNGGIGTSKGRAATWPGTNIPTVMEMWQDTMEKFFLTRNGETGFKNGFLSKADIEAAKTFNYNAYPDSILQQFANGGLATNLNIPKFESGINMVPANMLAMLHKNEAVVPANMNPFNPNANNATMGGATYNITNNINGYDGDLNQLSNIITQRTMTAIKTLDSTNAKMVGTNKTVGIR